MLACAALFFRESLREFSCPSVAVPMRRRYSLVLARLRDQHQSIIDVTRRVDHHRAVGRASRRAAVEAAASPVRSRIGQADPRGRFDAGESHHAPTGRLGAELASVCNTEGPSGRGISRKSGV